MIANIPVSTRIKELESTSTPLESNNAIDYQYHNVHILQPTGLQAT